MNIVRIIRIMLSYYHHNKKLADGASSDSKRAHYLGRAAAWKEAAQLLEAQAETLEKKEGA